MEGLIDLFLNFMFCNLYAKTSSLIFDTVKYLVYNCMICVKPYLQTGSISWIDTKRDKSCCETYQGIG